MALTATATTKLRKEVASIISLSNEAVISISPEKSNILYIVKKFVSIEESFSSLKTVLVEKILDVPKTIIYYIAEELRTVLIYMCFLRSH